MDPSQDFDRWESGNEALFVLRRDSDQRKASRKSRDGQRRSASSRSNGSSPTFVLYVEGARDREILACWARRIDRELARVIEEHSVILGGRRPVRALADFRKRGGSEAGLTGLIVLDRDEHVGNGESDSFTEEAGLGVFIWRRRHIESYLLVPAALRRLARLDPEDHRIDRFVEDEIRGADVLHAKRILGHGGSLALVLGTELRAGDIARAMRREEFDPEIFDLFARIRRGAGLPMDGPQVVVRSRAGS